MKTVYPKELMTFNEWMLYIREQVIKSKKLNSYGRMLWKLT